MAGSRIINFNFSSVSGIAGSMLYDMVDNEGNFVFQRLTGTTLLSGLTLSISNGAASFNLTSTAQSATWSIYNPYTSGTNAPSNYLAETTTYISSDSALNSLTTIKKDAIDRWFKDLQGYSNGSYTTYNVWSKIKILYPFIGGSSTSLGKNAKTPGTYDMTHTGSPTFNANSISYNGSSQYSNTNFIPNTDSSILTSDFTGYVIHRTDTNADTNATVGALGGGNSFAYFNNSGGYFSVFENGVQAHGGYPANIYAASNAFYAAFWASSTNIRLNINGTNFSTLTSTFGAGPIRSMLIGAYNNSAIGYGGPNTPDFYMSVTGTWSDAEMQSVYNATKALKSVLGVTWN